MHNRFLVAAAISAGFACAAIAQEGGRVFIVRPG